MDEIKGLAGKITGVHMESIHLKEPFPDMAARFTQMTGTVLLLSGGDLDCARYHILGVKPWLTFLVRNGRTSITFQGRTIAFQSDPFDTLSLLLKTFRIKENEIPVPMAAGLMGYLSYDLKDHLEDLPRTSIDDLGLPLICLFAPSIIMVHDRHDGRTWLCIPKQGPQEDGHVDRELKDLKRILGSKAPLPGNFMGNAIGFRSNFMRPAYMTAIEKIREYIASGHVYQVNFSQRFEMGFSGNPFVFFQRLYDINPAPFFAYINGGDHQIVSTSPERFLKQTGKHVETRPIKGTRPRGKTKLEDKRFRLELEQSPKDDAELSMIVDLLRNDLGKVCQGGSVRVAQHKRLEAYENVYHLVSIVEGILDQKHDSVDLIRATFPGGSITGCPKIRAMEIIDEIEPHRRHVYTGAIGYISFHDTMDLSIAIRTATLYKQKMIFSVGGGIVYDSDPADEYEETLHKGKTLMETFKKQRTEPAIQSYIWINGAIVPLDRATINITDLGFQYGYGFFETIRVDKGMPKLLTEHMARFNRAWKQLFDRETPDLSWHEIIHQVIHENKLEEEITAAKIIAAWGSNEGPHSHYTLIVMAKPYTHRLDGRKEKGLALATYPHPRQTPLADHKTLNYLYYYLAGKWAQAQGADEALILNPDGTISETNTANILLIQDDTAVIPISTHVLPGIMETKAHETLKDWGYALKKKKVRPDDLFKAHEVIITNSLIGAVPILSVDSLKMKKPSGLFQRLNDILL